MEITGLEMWNINCNYISKILTHDRSLCENKTQRSRSGRWNGWAGLASNVLPVWSWVENATSLDDLFLRSYNSNWFSTDHGSDTLSYSGVRIPTAIKFIHLPHFESLLFLVFSGLLALFFCGRFFHDRMCSNWSSGSSYINWAFSIYKRLFLAFWTLFWLIFEFIYGLRAFYIWNFWRRLCW